MKKIIEVTKLKAYTQNEFDTNGDIVYLTIKVNAPLKELLKSACADSLDNVSESIYTGEDESGHEQSFSFMRYKAKAIFYRELNRHNGARNILYSVELLDNGLIKIPFYSVYKENDFLSGFQNELKRLTELLIGENLEREISFNLSEPIAE